MEAQKVQANDCITYTSLLAYETDRISGWRQQCAEAESQLASANSQLAAAVDINKCSTQR